MLLNRLWRGGLAAACLWLAGCAGVPDVEPLLNQAGDGQPTIVGARGPLTDKQSAALLKTKGVTGPDVDALTRHLVIEEAVAETPLVAGNAVKVLRDGINTFRAMFAAIRAAKSHVHLEYYILEDVESDGEKLSDLLLAKQASGVPVRIIYDSFGSGGTPGEFFDKLKSGGVLMVAFNPVNPLKAKGGYNLNDRDHRKILIADGEVGIVGGVNLSSKYQSGPGKSGPPKKKPNNAPAIPPSTGEQGDEHWRDTDLEIRGPVVAQLQAFFLEHWAQQKGPALDQTALFPRVPPAGTEIVRIIGSTPRKWVPKYYVALLSAIRTAEKSILLSAAYFVPTRQERKDLEAAARRGVDVRLLLAGRSDSKMSLSVQHSHYEDLFEAGIKIYETQNEILHSKSVVVDGVWTIIGSSNLDHRSVLFNDEVDAVIVGKATGQTFTKMFEDDAKRAVLVDPELWKRRPLTSKVNDTLARIWESLL